MYVIVDKKADKLTVKEMDGRLQNDVVKLSSRIGQMLLRVAYRVPNGTVEYK